MYHCLKYSKGGEHDWTPSTSDNKFMERMVESILVAVKSLQGTMYYLLDINNRILNINME